MKAWLFNRFKEVTLASFVTPAAALRLETPVPHIPARDKASRRQLVQAIYDTLLGCGINYVLEPYSEEPEQEIRPPDAILKSLKQGTCLDLALLFCGLCEANELIPVMVMLDGHALAAVSTAAGGSGAGWIVQTGASGRRARSEAGDVAPRADQGGLIRSRGMHRLRRAGSDRPRPFQARVARTLEGRPDGLPAQSRRLTSSSTLLVRAGSSSTAWISPSPAST